MKLFSFAPGVIFNINKNQICFYLLDYFNYIQIFVSYKE